MKKILPFQTGIVGAFSHQASLLSILFAYEECKPWIYSNYIQIYTLKDYYQKGRGCIEYYVNYYGDMELFDHSTCPWLHYNRYDREYVQKNSKRFRDFLTDRLDRDEYIYLTLNYTKTCGVNMGYHPSIIFGYDMEKMVFHMADNYLSGKYVTMEIKMDDVDSACFLPHVEDVFPGRTRGIITYRKIAPHDYHHFAEHGDYPYSMRKMDALLAIKSNKIRQDLRRYLLQDRPGEYGDCTDYIFGIDCMREYKQSAEAFEKRKNKHDLRAISCLCDHKRLMNLRIEYFIEHQFCSREYKGYQEVYNKMLLCRNLEIKRAVTGNDAFITKCGKLAEDAVRLEEHILGGLASDLHD